MLGRVRGLLFAGALAAVLGASALAGAAPTDADKARARALLNQGYDLMEQGDPKTAVGKFIEADNLVHYPITALSLARAQNASGELLAARASLQRAIDDPPKPGEPPAFTQARKDATELAKKLDASIPSISVKLVKPPANVELRLDGNLFAPPWDQPHKVDPGSHLLAGKAGDTERTRSVSVAEGEEADVSLDFSEPQVETPPAPPPSSKPGAQPVVTPPPSRHVRWYTYAAFGVGVVGLGFGGVTGGLAMSARDAAVRDGCVSGKCPPAAQSDEHNSQNLATFSTVGFAVGLAGLTAGLITLFLPQGDSEPAPAAATSAPAGVRAHLEVGPTFLGISGEM